ncbi:MAG: hypothetical protein NTY69_06060 [Methylococcales bacterium]|nr:hypothetical protein [Methylococcales bacterium]
MNTNLIKNIIGLLVILSISACSSSIQPVSSDKATTDYHSQISDLLRNLPPPKKPIVVGVYKFRDQTGQYKSSESLTQYSTAVTQGGTSMLIRALMEAGNGRWFTVLEREGLTDLMNERKIINQTRESHLSEAEKNSDKAKLPPMLYAPVLLEGGVIAYETNLLTGGVGARYFGIGGSTEFRRDTVTSMLRAVAVTNGEILNHVDSRKTIFSMQMDSGLYRYVSYQRLMEFEAGISSNEPPQMAVLESIEACVYAMIVEGLIKNNWALADPSKKNALIAHYLNKNIPEATGSNDADKKDDDNNKDNKTVNDVDKNVSLEKTNQAEEQKIKDEQEAKLIAAQRVNEDQVNKALIEKKLEDEDQAKLLAEQRLKDVQQAKAVLEQKLNEVQAKADEKSRAIAETEAQLAQKQAEKQEKMEEKARRKAEREEQYAKAKAEQVALAEQKAKEKAEKVTQWLAAIKAKAEKRAKIKAEREEQYAKAKAEQVALAEQKAKEKAEKEAQWLAAIKAKAEERAKIKAEKEAQWLAAIKAKADEKARRKAEIENIDLEKKLNQDPLLPEKPPVF